MFKDNTALHEVASHCCETGTELSVRTELMHSSTWCCRRITVSSVTGHNWAVGSGLGPSTLCSDTQGGCLMLAEKGRKCSVYTKGRARCKGGEVPQILPL